MRKVAPAGTVSEAVAAQVANAFTSLLTFATGTSSLSQNTIAALDSLTTTGLAKFNAKYPAGVPTTSCGSGASLVNGVRYSPGAVVRRLPTFARSAGCRYRYLVAGARRGQRWFGSGMLAKSWVR